MSTMPGDHIQQRILLMRHPETVSNTEHFFSGQTDVALSPRGEIQREHAIKALVAFAPDRIFCSPLSRAHDLAIMAAEHLGVPCTPLDDLLEIGFGPLEGVRVEDAAAKGMSFPWPVNEQGISQPFEGAESFEHLRKRADRMVERLRPLSGKTACVTHGGYLRMLMASLYDIPLTHFWNMHILNVSSLYFTCDGSTFSLGGFNMSPEEVIANATEPNNYDTRDIWGTGRGELA